MVSMTNGELVHEVADADVKRFEAAGWTKVQPAKREQKSRTQAKEA